MQSPELFQRNCIFLFALVFRSVSEVFHYILVPSFTLAAPAVVLSPGLFYNRTESVYLKSLKEAVSFIVRENLF